MSEYVYDQSFAEERERLAGMERLWDEGTRALLERLGVSDGWSCLEVGAGGGSVTRWLAERVGEGGRVVAADVDTRFLEQIELPNVEVRKHDILADELPEAEFDLVFARLVVEHLGSEALRRMVPALRPGGILVLEDYDFSCAKPEPPSELFDRVQEAVLGFMADAGFDPFYGRRLVTELDDAGLEDVTAEGRARLIRGGTPETAFFKLSIVSLRPVLIEKGVLSEAEADEAIAEIDDPSRTLLTPLMVAGWGRAPAS